MSEALYVVEYSWEDNDRLMILDWEDIEKLRKTNAIIWTITRWN